MLGQSGFAKPFGPGRLESTVQQFAAQGARAMQEDRRLARAMPAGMYSMGYRKRPMGLLHLWCPTRRMSDHPVDWAAHSGRFARMKVFSIAAAALAVWPLAANAEQIVLICTGPGLITGQGTINIDTDRRTIGGDGEGVDRNGCTTHIVINSEWFSSNASCPNGNFVKININRFTGQMRRFVYFPSNGDKSPEYYVDQCSKSSGRQF
jgi:hypothetical protein